jgi:hypothetical protein
VGVLNNKNKKTDKGKKCLMVASFQRLPYELDFIRSHDNRKKSSYKKQRDSTVKKDILKHGGYWGYLSDITRAKGN